MKFLHPRRHGLVPAPIPRGSRSGQSRHRLETMLGQQLRPAAWARTIGNAGCPPTDWVLPESGEDEAAKRLNPHALRRRVPGRERLDHTGAGSRGRSCHPAPQVVCAGSNEPRAPAGPGALVHGHEWSTVPQARSPAQRRPQGTDCRVFPAAFRGRKQGAPSRPLKKSGPALGLDGLCCFVGDRPFRRGLIRRL